MKRPAMRYALLFALSATLQIPVMGASAQEATRIPTVGILTGAAVSGDTVIEAFRQGMRDLGYVEGRNIRFEFRTADGQLDRLPALAKELAQLKPDVVAASSSSAALAVNRASPDTPIVMFLSADPMMSGLVKSLAHPGGKVTGFSIMTSDLSAKLLQLLKDAFPRIKRVAVLWSPDTPVRPWQIKMAEELKAAAASLSLELVFIAAWTLEDIEAVVATNASHAQALVVADSPHFYARRAELVQALAKARLPAIYRTRAFVDAGGLMSYGPSWTDLARRSSVYVDKILKGTAPGDLPIEQPTKFEHVINLKTAKALGVKVPQPTLQRADEVIQ